MLLDQLELLSSRKLATLVVGNDTGYLCSLIAYLVPNKVISFTADGNIKETVVYGVDNEPEAIEYSLNRTRTLSKTHALAKIELQLGSAFKIIGEKKFDRICIAASIQLLINPHSCPQITLEKNFRNF